MADVVDEAGTSVPLGGGGYLVLERPWPAMLRGLYKDPERYEETYWSRYPGRYFAGDGCKRDEEGYYWLLGRDRRRDERLRAPHLDHRGGVGPRLAPVASRRPRSWDARTRSPARPSSAT